MIVNFPGYLHLYICHADAVSNYKHMFGMHKDSLSHYSEAETLRGNKAKTLMAVREDHETTNRTIMAPAQTLTVFCNCERPRHIYYFSAGNVHM